jgi:hypothetical protein
MLRIAMASVGMCVALGVVGLACNKEKDAPSGGAPTTRGDLIGVKECDDYLAKVDACLAKDATLKAQLGPGVNAQRDAWKTTALNNRESLRSSCKLILDNFSTAMPNCK